MKKINCICGSNVYYLESENAYYCLDTSCFYSALPLNVIDIDYRGKGLEKVLSNLFPYEFEMDNVKCSSMEGFLQSLKEPNKNIQKEVCKLYGFNAYAIKECLRDWRESQTLYWLGKEYKRESKEYFELLKRAFKTLFWSNSLYSKALMSSKNAILIHSQGCTEKKNLFLRQMSILKFLICY